MNTTVPNRAVAYARPRRAQLNRAMRRKLDEDKCIDVTGCERDGNFYVLTAVVEGKDYCDTRRNAWVWSIGRRRSDGKILASLRTDLYEHPDFECLWLR
jgi:hypothetical protein